ncbi:hypothetical protein HK099_006397 [Clydaea vesicula]|uniref:BRCT domain-containing protein n=1 Tax=Clydaea vesicula TaxID=447962 RepID=A0AAD5Y0W1_9FUNG|nr:hypothetical protein HK099_006397 [Clydaea vesicula]
MFSNLKFFLAPNLEEKTKLFTLITKHNGSCLDSQSSADYILVDKNSTESNSKLELAVDFITDSIINEKLLNTNDYLIQNIIEKKALELSAEELRKTTEKKDNEKKVFLNSQGTPITFRIPGVLNTETKKLGSLIEENGGILVNATEKPDILLVNPEVSTNADGVIYSFVTDSVDAGVLLTVDEYKMSKHKNFSPIFKAPLERIPFTSKDNYILMRHYLENDQKNSLAVWRKLAEDHSTHSPQSWKNRFNTLTELERNEIIKKLERQNNYDDFTYQATRQNNNKVASISSTNFRDSLKRTKTPFSFNDEEILLEHFIISGRNNSLKTFKALEKLQPHHTAESWRNKFKNLEFKEKRIAAKENALNKKKIVENCVIDTSFEKKNYDSPNSRTSNENSEGTISHSLGSHVSSIEEEEKNEKLCTAIDTNNEVNPFSAKLETADVIKVSEIHNMQEAAEVLSENSPPINATNLDKNNKLETEFKDAVNGLKNEINSKEILSEIRDKEIEEIQDEENNAYLFNIYRYLELDTSSVDENIENPKEKLSTCLSNDEKVSCGNNSIDSNSDESGKLKDDKETNLRDKMSLNNKSDDEFVAPSKKRILTRQHDAEDYSDDAQLYSPLISKYNSQSHHDIDSDLIRESETPNSTTAGGTVKKKRFYSGKKDNVPEEQLSITDSAPEELMSFIDGEKKKIFNSLTFQEENLSEDSEKSDDVIIKKEESPLVKKEMKSQIWNNHGFLKFDKFDKFQLPSRNNKIPTKKDTNKKVGAENLNAFKKKTVKENDLFKRDESNFANLRTEIVERNNAFLKKRQSEEKSSALEQKFNEDDNEQLNDEGTDLIPLLSSTPLYFKSGLRIPKKFNLDNSIYLPSLKLNGQYVEIFDGDGNEVQVLLNELGVAELFLKNSNEKEDDKNLKKIIAVDGKENNHLDHISNLHYTKKKKKGIFREEIDKLSTDNIYGKKRSWTNVEDYEQVEEEFNIKRESLYLNSKKKREPEGELSFTQLDFGFYFFHKFALTHFFFLFIFSNNDLIIDPLGRTPEKGKNILRCSRRKSNISLSKKQNFLQNEVKNFKKELEILKLKYGNNMVKKALHLCSNNMHVAKEILLNEFKLEKLKSLDKARLFILFHLILFTYLFRVFTPDEDFIILKGDLFSLQDLTKKKKNREIISLRKRYVNLDIILNLSFFFIFQDFFSYKKNKPIDR